MSDRTYADSLIGQRTAGGGITQEGKNAGNVVEHQKGKPMRATLPLYTKGGDTMFVDFRCPDLSSFSNGTALASNIVSSALRAPKDGRDMDNAVFLYELVESARQAATSNKMTFGGEMTLEQIMDGRTGGVSDKVAKQCKANFDQVKR